MRQSVIRAWLVNMVAGGLVALCAASSHAQSAGETLFKSKCAECHARDGSGDTTVGKKLGTHDFRSARVQKMLDAELTEITAKGKNKMPGYEKSLKPDEIKGLVTYIRSLAAKK
jgi:mono/diheme cytochrome c family protein